MTFSQLCELLQETPINGDGETLLDYVTTDEVEALALDILGAMEAGK